MFNLEEVRNLNKVSFIFNGEELNKGKWFTTKGWDFNFNVKTNDVIGGAVNLINSPLLSSVVGRVIGASTVLDISRKYAYAGTDPIRASIPCYLILKDSPDADIIEPLNRLLNLILPVRNSSARQTIDEILDKIKAESAESGAFWDLVNKALDALGGFTGDVYTLKVPEYFKANSGALQIKWGGHLFDDVFINSIHVRTNTFVYGMMDGGEMRPIPDCAFVDISFETTRVVSLESGQQGYFKRFNL